MKLRDVMTAPVLGFRPSDPASDVLAWMRDASVRHAPVLEGDVLVGVVSERDLGGPHGGAVRRSRTVGELMQTEPIVAAPELDLDAATILVRQHRIGCLPVVERGRVVGIVTRSDLLAALANLRRRGRQAADAHRASADPMRPPLVVSPNRDKWP